MWRNLNINLNIITKELEIVLNQIKENIHIFGINCFLKCFLKQKQNRNNHF